MEVTEAARGGICKFITYELTMLVKQHRMYNAIYIDISSAKIMDLYILDHLFHHKLYMLYSQYTAKNHHFLFVLLILVNNSNMMDALLNKSIKI